jgi:hypothetical protein
MKLNRSESYPLEHAVDIRARHPKGKTLLSTFTFIVQWNAILEKRQEDQLNFGQREKISKWSGDNRDRTDVAIDKFNNGIRAAS